MLHGRGSLQACKAESSETVLARVLVCCIGPTGLASWSGPSPHRPHLPDPLLCLQIRGTDKSSVRELHIAYRYGEHYDSVRRINDNSEAPAHLQTDVSDAPGPSVPSACRPAGAEHQGPAVAAANEKLPAIRELWL